MRRLRSPWLQPWGVVTVVGHGTWSIAPNGRVIRGALFLERKLARKRVRS
jgi:hypothetical protein